MLEDLKQHGVLKVEAFLAWLADRQINIDRTLVSHWIGARSHLPADILPCLADFTGRPELVFGPYVREVECEIVRVPHNPLGTRELIEMVLALGATLGRLQSGVIAARSPQSPGGEEITPEERKELGKTLDELIHLLVGIKEQLGPPREKLGGTDAA